MKILGKHVGFHSHAAQKGDPFFLGLAIDRDHCEGCGGAVDTMEVGLGLIVFAVTVHNH